jgi:hypothetical protein
MEKMSFKFGNKEQYEKWKIEEKWKLIVPFIEQRKKENKFA